MEGNGLPMSRLPLGKQAVVQAVGAGPGMGRLVELGLVPGTVVEALHRSPSGDPVAYRFRGVVVALRDRQASTVLCSLV